MKHLLTTLLMSISATAFAADTGWIVADVTRGISNTGNTVDLPLKFGNTTQFGTDKHQALFNWTDLEDELPDYAEVNTVELETIWLKPSFSSQVRFINTEWSISSTWDSLVNGSEDYVLATVIERTWPMHQDSADWNEILLKVALLSPLPIGHITDSSEWPSLECSKRWQQHQEDLKRFSKQTSP